MKRLAALVGIVIAAAPLYAFEVPQPTHKTASVFGGSAAVQALSSTWYEVHVDQATMTDAKLVGRVTASGGTGNDIAVAVFTEGGFVNWRNNHDSRPLFNSGQVTVADVAVNLPESGTYYVVFSNLFSAMTPKTVSGTLELRWMQMPSAAEMAAAEAANKAELEQAERHRSTNLVVWLTVLLLCGVVLGGGIAWMLADQRGKGQSEEGGRKTA